MIKDLTEKNNTSGFTLIELMVVITIIGILIALATFGLSDARKQSRDAKRKADLEQIRSALELYKSDNGTYPPGTSLSPLTSGNYISSIPTDPIAGRNYPYSSVSPYTTYVLCAGLETETTAVSGCGSCGTGVTCSYKTTNP